MTDPGKLDDTLREVLDHFPGIDPDAELADYVGPSTDGLINHTHVLRTVVVQRLHPIFGREVNLDIAALGAHLRSAGLRAPRVHTARDGSPWLERRAERTEVWRILERLPGRTVHTIGSTDQAAAAAEAFARFHGALRSVHHRFSFARPYAHDTAHHLAALSEAIARHPGHRFVDDARRIASAIAVRGHLTPAPTGLPERIVHGDPKISNVLFAEDDPTRIVAIIDLDTMARAPLDAEIGDALRSWTNTGPEDAAQPGFDREVYDATLEAYMGAAPWLTAAERHALPGAMPRICLELAARFALDALDERYFGWDPARFASRGDHNLARARNQLKLGELAADALGL